MSSFDIHEGGQLRLTAAGEQVSLLPIPDAETLVGSLWRDQDGISWRVVAETSEWIWVKRHGYPRSANIQTNPGWLREWTRLDV